MLNHKLLLTDINVKSNSFLLTQLMRKIDQNSFYLDVVVEEGWSGRKDGQGGRMVRVSNCQSINDISRIRFYFDKYCFLHLPVPQGVRGFNYRILDYTKDQ